MMQHYPREIIRGVEVLMHGCGAKKAIIAIEDDKQEAFNSLLMYNFNAHKKSWSHFSISIHLSLPSESITIHIPSIPDGCGIGRFSIAKTTPEIEACV
jgi:hypothetical protein